ncbi:MAG: glycoside hydrolase family protein [Porphyrobacter sp.]|nr:glycoside hydrolase family protein [Porphyrobacter sp.]
MPRSDPPLFAFLRRLLSPARTAPENAHPVAPETQGEMACVPSAAGRLSPPRSVGEAGLALIKRFEGCARLRPDGMIAAYPDPGTGGAPWTIGWGATGRDDSTGETIGPDTLWTQAQCDDRLLADLQRHAAEVAAAIGDAPTSQAQFDALVSFHYNTGAIARATLTARHRAGDFAAAAGEFARWNRAGGRVMKGLVRRRAAEAELYMSGSA